MGDEIIQFILELKDLFSGGMLKAAGTTEKASKLIDTNLAGNKRGLSDLGAAAVSTGNGFNTMGNTASNALNKINNKIADTKSRLSELANAGGRKGGGAGLPYWLTAAGVGYAGFEGAKKVWDITGEYQSQQVGLQTFLGDKKGKEFFNTILQASTKTPYYFQDLLFGARQLISKGMTPERSMKDVLSMANAVSATGGDPFTLQRMLWHLGQLKSSGQTNGIINREFAFAQLDIDAIVGRYLGKKITHSEHHPNHYSYDLVTAALARAAEAGGMFDGALQKQSRTLKGLSTTLIDYGRIAEFSMGNAQMPKLTAMMDGLIDKAKNLPAMAERWAPAIGNIIDGLMHLGGALFESAKFLYHNWTWIKVLIGEYLTFKLAIGAWNFVTGISNTLKGIAVALAWREASATTASTAALTGNIVANRGIVWSSALASKGIGVLTGSIEEATIAQEGFNLAMFANPVTGILSILLLAGGLFTAFASSAVESKKTITESLTSEQFMEQLKAAGSEGGKAYFDAFNAKKDSSIFIPGQSNDVIEEHNKYLRAHDRGNFWHFNFPSWSSEKFHDVNGVLNRTGTLAINMPKQGPLSKPDLKNNLGKNDPMAAAGAEGFESKADKINGGVPKKIEIHIAKFQDQTVIYADSTDKGIKDTERTQKQVLMRVLKSANALGE